MPAYRATLSSKGQITLPVEVRRAFGLEMHDGVTVRIEGDQIILRRDELTVEDVIGVLPPLPRGHSVDFDEEIEEAIDDALFGKNGKYRRLVQ